MYDDGTESLAVLGAETTDGAGAEVHHRGLLIVQLRWDHVSASRSV